MQNKKDHLRITKAFYRILLSSPNDSQTVALVPDEHFAIDITHLLSKHVKVRPDQNFIYKKDLLRPDTDKTNEQISWVVDIPDN